MARHASSLSSVVICFALLSLTCATCQSPVVNGSNAAPGAPASGSTVGPQSPPVPADSIAYLPAQSEAQQRRDFPTSSFTFAFDTPDTSTPGGNLSGLFVSNDQALATLPGAGVGQNLVSLAPCAVNQPHVHPRGTEISHITQGELLFGFIEENPNQAGTVGGRFINATLTAGQTVIVPQGLIHFAQNLQCEPAQFIASFPTSDPGTVSVAEAFFTKLPLATLRATLGIDDAVIQAIVAKVGSVSQANPSVDLTCLANCGMSAPVTYYNNNPSGNTANGY
ncbi:hypothetical protein ABBQ32_011738 [Trebouxia sp. C0010 RCD-2024]